ncbi:hypothetical protein CFR75_14135 [Komagataeibacter xylinus]|uniref:Uncharacterized protein n=2 Tax=Komagataeibacter xylinus TaxID=28448 RepID=A0A318PJJ5_KOMXY|nr:hypothetical protein CFR75_14135 [Komagataeibacter xylinus]
MMHGIDPHDIFDFEHACLSADLIRARNWCCVIVREHPGLVGCEWIEKAFSRYDQHELYVFSLPLKAEESRIETVQCNKKSIFHAMNENCGLEFSIFSKDMVRLFFSSHEYYIVCGERDFVQTAYPVSFETSKDVFFCDFRELRTQARDFFSSLWDTYACDECRHGGA